MIETFIPRIAAVNDLSGFGRVSLNEAIPIMSAMGAEVCPLPTAVLSTHTYKFEDYTFCDLTEEMKRILNHWRNLDIKFNAVCSGYMASAKQIRILSEFISEKKAEGTTIVIDPVLGDNDLSDAESVYYDRMSDLISEMKKFVSLADVITPNLTEACLLLGIPYPKNYLSKDEISRILVKLSEMGPRGVAITSIMTDENHMCVAVYDKEKNEFSFPDCGFFNRPFHGTGDIFAAVLTGALAFKKSLFESAQIAVDFVKASISETMKYPDIKIEYGVVFEKILTSFFKDFN